MRPTGERSRCCVTLSLRKYICINNKINVTSNEMSISSQQRVRRLYLLFGFRAAGKTTLLTRGLQQGFCPFGDEHLEAFSTLVLPENPSSTPGYEQAKRSGSWFDMSHIHELAKDKILPQALWIHVDLLSLLYCSGTVIDDPSIRTPMLPHTLETAYSEQQISHSLIRYFTHPFFKRFDEMLVNVLYAPWEVCKAQWRIRQDQTKPSFDLFEQYVFEEGAVGESIHKAAYDGLATAMMYLKPTRLFQSQMVGDTLALKTLLEEPSE